MNKYVKMTQMSAVHPDIVTNSRFLKGKAVRYNNICKLSS